MANETATVSQTNGVEILQRVCQPITTTDIELRTHQQPSKMKGFKVILNGQVRYTYAHSPDSALARIARVLGGKVMTLGAAPTQEQVLSEMLSLPEDQLKALVDQAQKNLGKTVETKAPEKAKTK